VQKEKGLNLFAAGREVKKRGLSSTPSGRAEDTFLVSRRKCRRSARREREGRKKGEREPRPIMGGTLLDRRPKEKEKIAGGSSGLNSNDPTAAKIRED